MPAGLALTNTYPGNKVSNELLHRGRDVAGRRTYYFELSGTSMASADGSRAPPRCCCRSIPT